MDRYEIFTPNGEPGFTLRRGHPAIEVGYQQLRRYALDGVERDGRVIKLRVYFNPFKVSTTLSEWHRFLDACNEK